MLEQKEEELKKNDNPFALVVLAGLYTIKTQGVSANKKEQRYKFKKTLIKILREKGWPKEKILDDEDENMGLTIEMTPMYQVLEKKFRKEGRQEGRLDVAKRLLSLGIDKETIIKASGLSEREIDSLKK